MKGFKGFKQELKIGDRVKIKPPYEDWQDNELIRIIGIGYGAMKGKVRVSNMNKKKNAEFPEDRIKAMK